MFGAEPSPARCFQLSLYHSLTCARALLLACSLSGVLREKQSRAEEREEGKCGVVFLPSFFLRRPAGESFRRLGDATCSETLTATLDMLQPQLRCFLPSFFIFFLISPPPADGQATAGGAAVERVQVMFTPTICKVRCSQDRCVNYCERGNVTTLYSSNSDGEGGRRDGAHGPGFRVCKFTFLASGPGLLRGLCRAEARLGSEVLPEKSYLQLENQKQAFWKERLQIRPGVLVHNGKISFLLFPVEEFGLSNDSYC